MNKLRVLSQGWTVYNIDSTKRLSLVPAFFGVLFLQASINLNCILDVLLVFGEYGRVVILKLFIPVTVKLGERNVAVSSRILSMNDMIYLISHLLVLF